MSTELRFDNRKKKNNKYSKGKNPNGNSGFSPKQGKNSASNGSSGNFASKYNKNYRKKPNYKQPQKVKEKPSVRIAFLGGLNEIGKNITMIECENDIILIDCGMAFPDGDMLGVDLVIPDFTYVEQNKDRIKGIILTHGHEDHIGGLPFLLSRINIPIYGTALTLGLLGNKLKEHNLYNESSLNRVNAGETIRLGCMSIEFIHVNHSIPDAVGFAIRTPAGTIVHTGDFKIDCTPIMGGMIDLSAFARVGDEGVLALLAESTNAERPGYTQSEHTVGESFSALFKKAKNDRIIVATFSSNIHRIQQIVDEAVRNRRKVAVSGRSMLNVVNVATELGYLKIPDGVLIEIETINRYQPSQLVIVTTGSQGEPMSALHRMAHGEHRNVNIGPQDTIIISASPIPGNEKTVADVVNGLMKLGAHVIYEKMYEVHVSGHACQEELKMMLGIVKPKFFLPVHGEQKQLRRHAEMAMQTGIDKKNILINEIGRVVELTPNSMKQTGAVQSGRVLVDGLGVGDVGSIVLRDRMHLAEDGIIIAVMTIESESGEIVSGPDIVSRGFIYVRESEELINRCKKMIEACVYNS